MQYTDLELRIALRTFRQSGATSLTSRQVAVVIDYRNLQFASLQAINDAIAFADYMTTTPLENVEVWYVASPSESWDPETGNYLPIGWYWWYCLPGCLSNDYPHGPHQSEQAAIIAAYVEQYELHLQAV